VEQHGLPPFFSGPGAWNRSTLNSTGSWVWHLNCNEVGELERAADNCIRSGITIPYITRQRFDLPQLSNRSAALRRRLISGYGVELVRGLDRARYSKHELATIFFGFCAHLGLPQIQNAKGRILEHVMDLGSSSLNPNTRVYQTAERQTFHTDSCDVVALVCVCPAAKGGLSRVVSIETVYNEIRKEAPDLLSVLFDKVATDRRGENPPSGDPFVLIPVLNWFENELTPFYQRQYIDSAQRFSAAPVLSSRQIDAMNLLDDVAERKELQLEMSLEAGDMQFIYNHRTLHDRTEYYDTVTQQRHLMRIWVSVIGDRELPPCFKTRYGSIEVGNRGGIGFAVPRSVAHLCRTGDSQAKSLELLQD
jgi:hypothetical protein